MRILQLSASDSKGGAAKICLDLSRGLVERGHSVELHCIEKHADAPWIHELPPSKTKQKRIVEAFVHRLGIPCVGLSGSFPRAAGREFFEAFDVIHLHDPPAFNLTHLKWLGKIRPVVWSLHNQAAFTGNCIFSYDCNRWEESCGSCPEFGKFPLDWFSTDGSRTALKIKKQIFRSANIHILHTSQWLADQQTRSILKDQTSHLIENSAETANFRPIDRVKARDKLGIPQDAKVVVASLASNPRDRRKGSETILKCLKEEASADEGWFLIPLGIGPGADRLEEILKGIPHLPPQHFEGEEALNEAFNCADVGWHPSLADNAPLSVLEMMASGLPVVAGRVGGVPEMIEEGKNGMLIDPTSAKELAAATRQLMENLELRSSMGKAARETVIGRFSRDRFVRDHLDLYESILPPTTTI